MGGLARHMGLVVILCGLSADPTWAASCCIAEADTCHVGAACFNGGVASDGLCAVLAFSKDCGAPFYCPFDWTLGCLTANQCSAAKLTAASKATRATLRCDSRADNRGVAVNPACTSKAAAPLSGAFSLADASGPCPGSAATVQNDITAFESNVNTLVGNAGAIRTRSREEARKVALTGKEAARFLACESKAAMTGIDPSICLLHVEKSPRPFENEAVDPFVGAVVDHLASPSGAFLAGSTVF